MKNKNIICNFTIGFAFIWSISLLFSVSTYSILVKSVAYAPFLIVLGVVFGLSYYFNKKYNPETRYFLIAYAIFPVFLLIIFSNLLILLFFFSLFILVGSDIFGDEIKDFAKKQRFIAKLLIYTAYLGLFLIDLFFTLFFMYIFLVSNKFIQLYNPTTIPITYSSTPLLYPQIVKNFNDTFLISNYFNPVNTTTIKGIIHTVKADNISYENSFRAYCLNAQTDDYWIQDCISYRPYYTIFSNSQDYSLQTAIILNQTYKFILNTEEMISNASIYKNQTFYLKLVVKNNTYVVYETNNGKTEYIKVSLPKNKSFGAIANASMSAEIHQWSFYSINTGLVGFYSLNATLQSFSGNFTNNTFEDLNWSGYYLSFFAFNNTNNPICRFIPLANNNVRDVCFKHKMNLTQIEDLKSLEGGNCRIFYYGSFAYEGKPPLQAIALKDWNGTPNMNSTLCNSNETLGEFLKSRNES